MAPGFGALGLGSQGLHGVLVTGVDVGLRVLAYTYTTLNYL